MSKAFQVRIKRGDKNWNYFIVTFTVLLGITLSIISALDMSSFLKIFLIILAAALIFYFCFYNEKFGRGILRMLGRLEKNEQKEEREIKENKQL